MGLRRLEQLKSPDLLRAYSIEPLKWSSFRKLQALPGSIGALAYSVWTKSKMNAVDVAEVRIE